MRPAGSGNVCKVNKFRLFWNAYCWDRVYDAAELYSKGGKGANNIDNLVGTIKGDVLAIGVNVIII